MPILICPNCGAKNRVENQSTNLQPVCGRCKTKLNMQSSGNDRPITVTDDTLVEQLKEAGARPVLVDCWAPWCGPCRLVGPIMDQLAGESAGRYVVAKLNVDENQRTSTEFRIDSIPTMLIFKSGKLVDRLVGAMPKPRIQQRLMAAI